MTITPHDTARFCGFLSAAFPQWAPTGATITLFHQSLRDLPPSVVEQAVQDWILTEERPPTIAGLRKKCAEVSGALAPLATEAWAEVSDIAERYGYESYDNNPRPRWSHELIRKTVRAITWWEICSGSNPSAVRAQFIKAYEQYAQKEDKQTITAIGFSGDNKLALMNSTVVELSSTSNG